MSNKNSSYYLIKHVLTLLNEKFTTHGIRVAYIMLKMHAYENTPKDLKMKRLIQACIYHDIGAFKTEEVNDMLRFETTTPMQHGIRANLSWRLTS